MVRILVNPIAVMAIRTEHIELPGLPYWQLENREGTKIARLRMDPGTNGFCRIACFVPSSNLIYSTDIEIRKLDSADKIVRIVTDILAGANLHFIGFREEGAEWEQARTGKKENKIGRI